MKISYEEPKDLRIDAKRPIWREFFMVFVVQTVCVSAGIGLYQNHALSTLGNWGIYVALILNTYSWPQFLCFAPRSTIV